MKAVRVFASAACAAALWAGAARAAFDPLLQGAAAKGMGGAYTAVAEDGSAADWNPAALGLLRRAHFSGSAADLYGLGLLRHSVLGYTQPGLGGGVFAFQLQRLESVGAGSFLEYTESVYLLAHGRRLATGLYGGAGARYYSAEVGRKGTAVGGDLALFYRTGEGLLRLGAVARDVNEPRVDWDSGAKDVLPRTLRLGAALRLGRVDLASDQSWRRHEKAATSFGLAAHLGKDAVALRAGLRRGGRDDRWSPALGGGLAMKRLNVDYAWDDSEELGASQTVTLTFYIGGGR